MKKHILTRILMAGAVTAAAVAVVGACTRPKGPEQRAEWATNALSNKLDLKKDQRAKLDAVKTEVLAIMKAHKADHDQNIAEIKALILGEKLDAARIKALMERRQTLIDENFDRVYSKVAEFHAVLTPEQKKEAVELVDKFASHME